MGAYQIATGGVVRTADKAFIPNDAKNKDWIDYGTWVGLGNTADPAPTPSLSPYKVLQSAAVNAQADLRRQAIAPHYMGDILRFREATAAAVDGTPTSGEYPMLNAEAVAMSSTIAARATAVLAEEVTLRTSLAAVEGPRRTGLAAIAAAANVAAVDAAVLAIVWP